MSSLKRLGGRECETLSACFNRVSEWTRADDYASRRTNERGRAKRESEREKNNRVHSHFIASILLVEQIERAHIRMRDASRHGTSDDVSVPRARSRLADTPIILSRLLVPIESQDQFEFFIEQTSTPKPKFIPPTSSTPVQKSVSSSYRSNDTRTSTRSRRTLKRTYCKSAIFFRQLKRTFL